jgi:hypothetical protein
VLEIVGVLPTVDFNHEFAGRDCEISDVGSDWVLPSDFAGKRDVAQCSPKSALRICRRTSQVSRTSCPLT